MVSMLKWATDNADEGPLGRAERLAERMTKVLRDQDAAEVSLALALLTGGVVQQYSDTLPIARDLMESIRRVEDHVIERAFEKRNESVH